MAVGQLEQGFPVVERQHLAGRVARRADVEKLHARPFVGGERRVVEGEAVLGQRVEEARLGAGQVGGAFVDLVEGVGADDQRHVTAAGVDHRLGKGEKCLSGAVDRKNLAFRVEFQSVAALAPGSDGLAQRRNALRRRIVGQALEATRERFHDETGRRVLRLADRQLDLVILRVRRDAGKQGAQLFEGVGMELAEVRIHDRRRVSAK